MKFFEEPVVEVKVFEVEDIIAASEDEVTFFDKLNNILPFG